MTEEPDETVEPNVGDQIGAAATESSDRKPLVVLAVIALAIAAAVYFANRTEDTVDAGAVANQLGSSTVEVIYNVSGSADSADITIETPTGVSQQSVDVPLRNKSGSTGLRVQMPRGSFVYISAQNNGGGTITCSIVSDGITISENTSSGEYAIATCDGRA